MRLCQHSLDLAACFLEGLGELNHYGAGGAIGHDYCRWLTAGDLSAKIGSLRRGDVLSHHERVEVRISGNVQRRGNASGRGHEAAIALKYPGKFVCALLALRYYQDSYVVVHSVHGSYAITAC